MCLVPGDHLSVSLKRAKHLGGGQVACPVGEGGRIAAGEEHSPDVAEPLAVDFLGIANFVETEGPGQPFKPQ